MSHSRLKISIATGPYLPMPPIRGGAMPKVWHGLAAEFALRGHDVMIFARAFPGQPAEEIINGVHYQRWGGCSQSRSILADLVKDFIYAGRAVWRLPEADVLVTNDFWLPVFAGLCKPGAGRIVISANRFPKRQYFLYGNTARFAAASMAIKKAIIQQRPSDAPRVKIIPNPIDATLLSPPEDGRKNHSRPMILYVGRLHPEKGVHLLIEAFTKVHRTFPQTQLRLVGPIAENEGGGGSAYLQKLNELAVDLPIDFTGPVYEPATLARIYQQADLFCYPSLAETGESFGVAPLEAMATGLAPIVSRLECFEDFVTNGESGWVFDHRAPDAIEALTRQLVHALSDPVQTLELGRRAHQAAQRFSYQRVADTFLADFEELRSGTKSLAVRTDNAP